MTHSALQESLILSMPHSKSASLRYRIIDQCLRNKQRKFPSLEDLVEKVSSDLDKSISSSMISKDLQFMRNEFSAPIAYDKNHRGYYYTEEDFSLEKFPLTHEEIEALDFSTALLSQFKGSKLFQQYENAINKVIEGYRVSKILGKSEDQIMQTETPVVSTDTRWLEILLKSILEKQLVQIIYKGFNRPESNHQFSPYLLKEYRNRWYVIGHSERAQNTIVLALDRIQKVDEAKGEYVSNEDFNAGEYFKYSIGITQIHGVKPREILLSFTPEQSQYVLSQPLHHSQEVVRSDEKEVVIRLFVYLSQELLMLILSYGAGVKVLEPAELRRQVEETVSLMQKNYL